MTNIINPKEWVHIPENSFYNHNFYRNKSNDSVILEICDECYGGYEYYQSDNSFKQGDFIGGSYEHNIDDDIFPFEVITEFF